MLKSNLFVKFDDSKNIVFNISNRIKILMSYLLFQKEQRRFGGFLNSL